jgi:hypothetical protein
VVYQFTGRMEYDEFEKIIQKIKYW